METTTVLAAKSTCTSPSQRRKNFSEDDDVALLRQVLLDRPCAQPRGKVMQHWDGMAATLVASPEIMRAKLSGKNAQSHINQLVGRSIERKTRRPRSCR
ncbi:hypothetical protein F442_05378, partial [Phytophthora nicotianae P10297]